MFPKPTGASGSPYVFLSHAGADSNAARAFAETLQRNGVNVWFDKSDLAPGDSWMDGLEKAIAGASGMLVYIGRMGMQAWVDREVRYGLILNTQKREAFRFIPVLADGAELAQLPPFVQQQQWVDLRSRV